MLVALKKDTPQNFRKKANNFLLSQFDPDVLFYTVFTSSFESKSGTRRLRLRDERRDDIYEAFTKIENAMICWGRLNGHFC